MSVPERPGRQTGTLTCHECHRLRAEATRETAKHEWREQAGRGKQRSQRNAVERKHQAGQRSLQRPHTLITPPNAGARSPGVSDFISGMVQTSTHAPAPNFGFGPSRPRPRRPGPPTVPRAPFTPTRTQARTSTLLHARTHP